MTRPRIIVPGATMALTRRTTHRKRLWTPFAKVGHQGWMYALARAQEKHEVLLHHGILQSNHAHTTVMPKEANLPEFLRYLHRESARGDRTSQGGEALPPGPVRVDRNAGLAP